MNKLSKAAVNLINEGYDFLENDNVDGFYHKYFKDHPSEVIEIMQALMQVGAADYDFIYDGGSFSASHLVKAPKIKDGVKTIQEDVFNGCSQMKQIYIPDSVKEIEAYSFSNCYGLEDIRLSNNLTYIGAYAFEHNERLKEVILPQGLKTIKQGAFFACGSLKELDIPESVTFLSLTAFNMCEKLRKVTVHTENLANYLDQAAGNWYVEFKK